MTATEFLKLFPQIKTNYGTGGNCTAWYLDLSHAKTHADWFGVLITDGVDACQPEMNAKRAMFGFVNDGEGAEPRSMTWAQAAQWMRGVMDYHAALTQWAP